MKRLFAIALALFCATSFGATMVPSTLINWVSAPSAPSQTASFVFAAPNGSAGAPTFRLLVASDIPTLAPLAGPTFTGAPTAPTAAVDTNTTQLATTAYVVGQGYLKSATAATTYATIAQATTALAATGGSINGVTTGLTTPLAGKFTTLQATSAITPSTTAGIIGTTLADNANAGSVGEYLSNTVLATALTNGAPFNAASITLTAGDWDVSGTISFINGAGASSSVMNASLSTTTATQNTAIGFMTSSPNTTTTAVTTRMSTPVARFSVSVNTTIFLVGVDTFSGGTVTSDGLIRARRVR